MGMRRTTFTGARPARRSNVGVMALSTGLNLAATMLWYPSLPLILRDLGANDLEVSLCTTVWTGGVALLQYWGGRWADRYGRHPIIVYPTYLAAVVAAAVSLTDHWFWFALVFTGWHAANAIQTPVFSAVVGESVAPERRGWAFGVVEFSLCIGIIAGPLIGAAFWPSIGSKGLFRLTAGIFLASAAIRHRFLNETRPESSGQGGFSLGQVLGGRLRLVLAVAVAFKLVASLTFWGPFLALHAGDAMGLSKQQVNLFFAAGSVASAVMSLLAGGAVKRWGTRRVLPLGAGLLAVSTLAWSVQRQPWAILAGYLAISGGCQLGMVALETFRVEALPDSIRGRALGAVGTIGNLMVAAAVPLAGLLRMRVNPAAPFALAAVAAVVLMLSQAALQRLDASHTPVSPSLSG